MEKKILIKLAVVGSRSFTDYGLLAGEIENTYKEFEIECIISGGARGADTLGAQFAKEKGIPLVELKPEWEKYGKKAGFIRNIDVINECTHCIAFWDGESHGTKHDIDLCDQRGKPCKVVPVNGAVNQRR